MLYALDKLLGICRRNKLVVDEETCRYLDLALSSGDDDFRVESHGSSRKACRDHDLEILLFINRP